MLNFKRSIAPLFIMFLAFFLSSCAYYQQYYDNIMGKTACYSACKTQKATCAGLCDQSAKICAAKADATAAVHFNQYRHQQLVKGEWVTLELKSFRDPLACLKSSCDCDLDYTVCKQSCQGKIYKRLQPISSP